VHFILKRFEVSESQITLEMTVTETVTVTVTLRSLEVKWMKFVTFSNSVMNEQPKGYLSFAEIKLINVY
jgi:hypothetical protein